MHAAGAGLLHAELQAQRRRLWRCRCQAPRVRHRRWDQRRYRVAGHRTWRPFGRLRGPRGWHRRWRQWFALRHVESCRQNGQRRCHGAGSRAGSQWPSLGLCIARGAVAVVGRRCRVGVGVGLFDWRRWPAGLAHRPVLVFARLLHRSLDQASARYAVRRYRRQRRQRRCGCGRDHRACSVGSPWNQADRVPGVHFLYRPDLLQQTATRGQPGGMPSLFEGIFQALRRNAMAIGAVALGDRALLEVPARARSQVSDVDGGLLVLHGGSFIQGLIQGRCLTPGNHRAWGRRRQVRPRQEWPATLPRSGATLHASLRLSSSQSRKPPAKASSLLPSRASAGSCFSFFDWPPPMTISSGSSALLKS